MPGPGDLAATAQAILDDAVQALGWTDRAYVSNGPPAFDCCPQLTVHALPMGPLAIYPDNGGGGVLAPGFMQQASQDAPTFGITILGCVPVARLAEAGGVIPPPAADITTSSLNLMTLAWHLWNWLRTKQHTGDQLLGGCRFVNLQGMTPLPDQGGCGGWLAVVQIQLDGYQAT